MGIQIVAKDKSELKNMASLQDLDSDVDRQLFIGSRLCAPENVILTIDKQSVTVHADSIINAIRAVCLIR